MMRSIHTAVPRGDPADETPEREVSRRGLLKGTGMGVPTIAVAGTGAVSYRAYHNRLLGLGPAVPRPRPSQNTPRVLTAGYARYPPGYNQPARISRSHPLL